MNFLHHLEKIPMSESTKDKFHRLVAEATAQSTGDEMAKDIPGYLPIGNYFDRVDVPDGYFRIFNYVSKPEGYSGIFGHFIIIDNRRPDRIVYCDPYGLKPDIGRKILKLPGDKYFENILERSRKPIYINHHQWQDFLPGDDACLAWCILFAMYPDLEDDPIYDHFHPNPNFDLSLEAAIVKPDHTYFKRLYTKITATAD